MLLGIGISGSGSPPVPIPLSLSESWTACRGCHLVLILSSSVCRALSHRMASRLDILNELVTLTLCRGDPK